MAQRKRTAAKTAAATRGRKASTSRRRRKNARGRAASSTSLLNGGMLAVRRGMSGDVSQMQAEIRDLASDLQNRLNKLNAITRHGASQASTGLQDFVSETLDRLATSSVAGLTGRIQDGATALTDQARRAGGRALKRVGKEVDRRPLMTLAIAAGIGFLAGLARRE